MGWVIGTVVMVATVGAVLLLTFAVQRQRQADSDIRQRLESVLTLRRTQALIVDAETGQRGFLLTSNPSFLEPYERARSALPGELRRLAASDIGQQSVQLRALINDKMTELAATIVMTRAGHKDAAIAQVEAGAGRRYMDAIRADCSQRIREERAKIDSSIARSEQFTSKTYVALSFLVFCAAVLLWMALSTLQRTRQLELEAVRLREVAAAEHRTALIARELNHRVKNLFSIVLAIIQLASRGATTPKEAVGRIRERIQALARAHEVSLGTDPMGRFDLETLLRTILAPYASGTAAIEFDGPTVRLPVMRVTPIGLIIHELATNALKYGAWSSDGGKLSITWLVRDDEKHADTRLLRLNWTEHRREPLGEDGTKGFGSRLIDAAIAQLDGTIVRERGEHELNITIEAPIVPS